MSSHATDLDPKQLLALYRQMQTIRQCEEELARCHQRGLIHGACHTYVGEEAIAVGVCAHLRPDDVVFSTHRGHGHALAKGVTPRQLIAELFGRATTCIPIRWSRSMCTRASCCGTASSFRTTRTIRI